MISRCDHTLFPVSCTLEDPHRFRVPIHWHEELEVGIVTEGAALLSIGSTKYQLQQGDGYFINSEVLHSAAAVPGSGICRIRSIVFHPCLISGGMDNIYWHKYILPLISNQMFPGICFLSDASQNRKETSSEPAHSAQDSVTASSTGETLWYQEILTSYDDIWHRQILESIDAAWQSCSGEEYGYEFQVREQLSRLVSLLHQHQGLIRNKSAEKDLRDNSRARQMLQYIQEHYAEQMTIEEIASSASIGESECFRCFHTVIGTPPFDYIRQYRLQQAAHLLVTSDLKIMDIGSQCGFQEMSHFARAFRKTYGVSPSAYRKYSKPETP